ncbi:unnamed protein product [Owenia fusiformis]|uniref:Metalloendopeptidase n=1 Tax=Owenia fusiformis TaxID=6347 RepID=A0A8J1UWE9_OWEFU|nr:unnamed protein product [Owenia fusiformis]
MLVIILLAALFCQAVSYQIQPRRGDTPPKELLRSTEKASRVQCFKTTCIDPDFTDLDPNVLNDSDDNDEGAKKEEDSSEEDSERDEWIAPESRVRRPSGTDAMRRFNSRMRKNEKDENDDKRKARNKKQKLPTPEGRNRDKTLFEGDIKKRERSDKNTPKFRHAMSNQKALWFRPPGFHSKAKAVIPYKLDSSYSEADKKIILAAMEAIETKTSSDGRCISFVEKDVQENFEFRDYVYIQPIDGCWSYVANARLDDDDFSDWKYQNMSLTPGCLSYLGVPIHEFLHLCGLYHEHTRPDRDTYIKIVWENIDPDFKENFEINEEAKPHDTPYDYRSVLHYEENEFAMDYTKPTIIPNKPVYIGQRDGLSALDILKLQRVYGCRETVPNFDSVAEGEMKQKCTFELGEPCTFKNKFNSITGKNKGEAEFVTLPAFNAPYYEATKWSFYEGYFQCLPASSASYGDVAIFQSPVMQPENYCLYFSFYMWQSKGSKLEVVISLVESDISQAVWTQEGTTKHDSWYLAVKDISVSRRFTVELRATMGDKDISFDEIFLVHRNESYTECTDDLMYI